MTSVSGPDELPGSTRSPSLATARAVLFVPGDRPERFAKAVAARADAVVLDLEDAVAGRDKITARSHVDGWLAGGRPGLVRINPPGTPWFTDDLAMARRRGAAVMLPKAEQPDVAADIADGTGGVCVLIETAAGVENATALCRRSGVLRAAFGSVDLATQLGVRHDDATALDYARSRIVLGCAAAGIAPPLEGVTTDLTNATTLDADIAHARRLGFGGKLCVHPNQVAAVVAGFEPTEDEIAWARKVVTAGESVSTVDGQMIDRPVLDRAKRILATTGEGRRTP